MKMKKKHQIGFNHAWDGIKYAFVYHHNLKIHLVVSILVVSVAWYFQLSKIEWVLLIIAIAFGLVVEMLNTAVESVVDLVTEEWRMSAKIAKDVASGAVLFASIGTALIGIIILGPKMVKLLFEIWM